jgi:hypothetical protein
MPKCCSNVSGVNFNDILHQPNVSMSTKKSLKYQRGNQNPYIEEEKKTQRSKDKVQQKKQRSTKHTYKTKVLVTWTPLRCSGRVSSSCSTSDTRRVNLVTNPRATRVKIDSLSTHILRCLLILLVTYRIFIKICWGFTI